MHGSRTLHARSRRSRLLLAGALGAALVLPVTAPASAAFVGASLPGSTFEIDTDANLAVDGAGTDWLSVGETKQADKPTGAGDDSFGQGTAENDAVPTVIDGSIPPNKSDLKHFGVYTEGTRFLHLYWARVQDPSGTTNMDFEFNASQVLSSNGVTPVRSVDDLLITYDLSNGGTVATLSLRTWTGSAWGPAKTLAGKAIGSVNSTVIPVAGADGLGGATGLSVRTFGEASIDLTAVFPAGQCRSFGSAYLKSRSSDSFTSAIKDFIAPAKVNVTNCAGVSIKKVDDAGAVLAGAVFTLYSNVAPLATRGPEDTVTTYSCTTAATGLCSIADVPFGSYWVVETTTPPGYDTAPDQALVVAGGGNTPSGTLTFVDPRQVGSILVSKVDASGGPLAGAAFTVTRDGVSTAMPSSAPGVFCLDGLLYGTYTVTETTVPAGYTGAPPQQVTVSTKSTCATRSTTPDLTFTNNPAPGRINVAKTDDAATPNPLAGAGFTLYVDSDADGTHDGVAADTVAQGPLTTGAAGTVSFTSVPLGAYCVVETTTPAGYATAAPQCRTVGLGSTSGTGQTINLSFVDPRLHRVIVLVCHEGTGTLDSSPVTIAGQQRTSLATPPAGITEAQLCALGGAAVGGLGHGTVDATVTVQ